MGNVEICQFCKKRLMCRAYRETLEMIIECLDFEEEEAEVNENREVQEVKES